jgi:hypothetical protein
LFSKIYLHRKTNSALVLQTPAMVETIVSIKVLGYQESVHRPGIR